MNTLQRQRKAKEMLETLERVSKATGEHTTLARYLCYLYRKSPNAVGFDELESELGVTQSQISRSSRALHKMNHRGNEGKDLIDITFDIHNPRAKMVTLNKRGEKAVESLLGVK